MKLYPEANRVVVELLNNSDNPFNRYIVEYIKYLQENNKELIKENEELMKELINIKRKYESEFLIK
jgi:hypothetical protein